jgi:hypothetical protein
MRDDPHELANAIGSLAEFSRPNACGPGHATTADLGSSTAAACTAEAAAYAGSASAGPANQGTGRTPT